MTSFRRILRIEALSEGYAVASVDAASVRAHMIDKVFHDVARQIDWDAGAIVFATRAFRSLGFSIPENTSDLTLERIAALNEFDQNELRLAFQRRLQSEILHDYEMTMEFRRAMMRLCQAQVDSSAIAQADKDAVLAWLRGELRLISALRQAAIFQKIARHNARDMLFSLARWVVKTGHSGLFLDLDIRSCAVSRGRLSPKESSTRRLRASTSTRSCVSSSMRPTSSRRASLLVIDARRDAHRSASEGSSTTTPR